MKATQCTIDGCGKPVLARGWCRTHYTRWYETGSTELGVRPRGNFQPVRPLADRFWEKVNKTDTCWLWTSSMTELGYGMIWSGPKGRQVMAHRVAWELTYGGIDTGLVIDHLCRVPQCVNPDHLELVTMAENTRRGYAPSIGAAYNLAKVTCPAGHPYDDANTYITRQGGRMCRTCLRLRGRAQREARRKGVPYVDPCVRKSNG